MLAQVDHFGPHALVRARVLLLETHRDSVHLRARLPDRHAILEPAGHAPVATHPNAGLVVFDRLRRIHIAVARRVLLEVRLKVIRDHARHQECGTVDGNGLPDNCWIAVELRPPEALAHHDDVVVAFLVFVRTEEPSDERLHAEEIEESFRHEHRLQDQRPFAAGVVEAVRLGAGELREALRARPPVEEVAGRDVLALGGRWHPLPERHNAIGFLIGQGPQQNLRHDAERRDRHGHAEGENADDGDHES